MEQIVIDFVMLNLI